MILTQLKSQRFGSKAHVLIFPPDAKHPSEYSTCLEWDAITAKTPPTKMQAYLQDRTNARKYQESCTDTFISHGLTERNITPKELNATRLKLKQRKLHG
jgi:hypothetical protein